MSASLSEIALERKSPKPSGAAEGLGVTVSNPRRRLN
jgi:hypothetical protein